MHAIPWITQYASPELIGAIAFEGHPKTDDPRWAESGAPDLEAYGFWCSRWCGMACLRMALIARDGDAPTLYELVAVTGLGGGAVTFHNPSGHTPESGIATLPIDIFDRFAAHRGVASHI